MCIRDSYDAYWRSITLELDINIHIESHSRLQRILALMLGVLSVWRLVDLCYPEVLQFIKRLFDIAMNLGR